MKKISLIAGILVILTGLVIASYPWLQAAYSSWLQMRAMNAWLAQPPTMTGAPAPVPDAAVSGGLRQADLEEEDENVPFDGEYVLKNMVGIITINKINLKAPILPGATAYHLNLAVCSVAGAGEMGRAGNYVLAGHKSRVKGRFFSRISELAEGDAIIVENRQSEYTYRVTEFFLVTPEDTWVMDHVTDSKMITLITCDYRTNPTGRLIVRGELTGEAEK